MDNRQDATVVMNITLLPALKEDFVGDTTRSMRIWYCACPYTITMKTKCMVNTFFIFTDINMTN